MVASEHVRDLVYTGPGEVVAEVGHCRQHLLWCYCRGGDMEIYNSGENREKEAIDHHREERNGAKESSSVG